MNSVFKDTIINQARQIQHNPAQFFLSNRIGIPQEYMNDPERIVNYLMENGRVTRDQVENTKEYMRKLGINI